MLNKNKRGKLFSRRALLLAGLKGSILSILGTRLYYLQIIKVDEYKTFSDSNRIKLFLLPPLRGKILDRRGKDIAINQNDYRVIYDPETAKTNVQTVEKLGKLLDLKPYQINKLVKKFKEHRSRRPLTLYEHLSWSQVSRVAAHSPDFPGMRIEDAQIRYFPMRDVSPHIIGYLGPIPEKELNVNPLLNHPDFKIGHSGVEKVFDKDLRGQAGVKRMEMDAFGLTVRELSREEAVPGKDIRLALDRDLHQYIIERLEGQSASVVVLNVQSGEIVAMASTPGFDPNKFTYGVSSDYWQTLMANLDKPLINKVMSNQYPPGSTFKMIVALAAQKAGIKPSQKVYCPGHYTLGRRRFHCWKEEGHGHMDMEQAIQHSCNTYFYTISKKIGIDAIEEMARKFGLGEPLNFGIPGEKAGIVPSREWKKKRFAQSWQAGDTLNTGIGQGFNLTTPIQLATMAARLATGRAVVPRLTPLGEQMPLFDDLGINMEHMEVVRRGMQRVVNVPGGTAFRSRTGITDFVMAGKTGTSQVISKKALKASFDTMTEEEKKRTENHALFVGYAPFKTPKYAISVIVEHGGGGSAAAAPVARDVMKTLYALDYGIVADVS